MTARSDAFHAQFLCMVGEAHMEEQRKELATMVGIRGDLHAQVQAADHLRTIDLAAFPSPFHDDITQPIAKAIEAMVMAAGWSCREEDLRQELARRMDEKTILTGRR